jgi:microcystin-dependent protein
MSNQFLAEIRAFGCNFAPFGWALCDGQILSISQNTALFSLLGTTYGGNGTSTFALPNLQGMAPMHWGASSTGTNYNLGDSAGSSTVLLLSNQIPIHTHAWQVKESGVLATATPDNTTWLGLGTHAKEFNSATTPLTSMAAQTIATSGSSVPHENMQPYLTINFCIAQQGIFPSRN